ncbi:MAG: hypothetical protein ACI934_001478 [Pseudohongiellaceae bacterium]|jgi:hypothetical protein
MTKKLLIIIPSALLVFAGAVYAFANYKVKTVVDTRITEMIENGDYLALEYASVGIKLNGDIVMNNLHVTDLNRNEYTLLDIRISDYDYFNPVPGHLNLSVRGLRFPADLPFFTNSSGNSLNNYLSAIMVEETLPLEISYRYDYHPEDESRLQNIFRAALPGSFSLTSNLVMTNLPMEALKQNPASAPANSSNMSTMPTMSILSTMSTLSTLSALIKNADIPNASMTLEDLGIVDAILKIQGDALGISSEEYRQQLLVQLQTVALFVPQQLQTLAQDFLGSFTEFLDGEKTFQLSIAPEYGGNIQQLQGEIMGAFYIGNIPRITELLNLDIETLQSN